MARNPAAQTAFGPMLQVAVEQYEPPGSRLVNDDLAHAILPATQRAVVHAMRWPLLRRLTISAGERAVPGSWALIACRKRFIDDKLDEALAEHRRGGHPRRWVGHPRLPAEPARSVKLVFEVDLPVNIAFRKAKTVRRVLGELPLFGSSGGVEL